MGVSPGDQLGYHGLIITLFQRVGLSTVILSQNWEIMSMSLAKCGFEKRLAYETGSSCSP